MIIIMEIYRASAFSKDGAGGNKAGVVADQAVLTSAQKQEIAKEVGYSETVFISGSRAADYRFEYFTPTDEVPLCGHATVAAFVVLNTLGRLPKKDCTIETGAGILQIQVREDGMVLMEQNRPTYAEILAPSELSGCFDERAFAPELPIQIVSTGLRDIFLPVRSAEALAHLKPDFAAMKRLSREKNVVGVHAFALAEDGGIDAVCRNFAPLYGIDEESATGTASGALACYLSRHAQKKSRYVFEQGRELGAASRITAQLEYDGEKIKAVFVGGVGYLL